MIWRDLFGGRKGGLDRIEQHVLDMLDADRHTLNLATRGLLGAADPDGLRRQASESDHRVNLLVQQVRRELVVHASLHGVNVDVGVMLATMSIVKDIERIGDYAKQLLRIARVRGAFAPGTAEHAQLTSCSDHIARYITDGRDTLAEHDADRATALITDMHTLTDELSSAIEQLLIADPAPPDGPARALAYYYLSRITAHLSNVLSSIVMPVDMLDFYDEQDADRSADSS